MCYNKYIKDRKEMINMKKWYETWTCPIEDYNCPYCNANAECMMDRPQDECDDFMAAYADITVDKEE